MEPTSFSTSTSFERLFEQSSSFVNRPPSSFGGGSNQSFGGREVRSTRVDLEAALSRGRVRLRHTSLISRLMVGLGTVAACCCSNQSFGDRSAPIPFSYDGSLSFSNRRPRSSSSNDPPFSNEGNIPRSQSFVDRQPGEISNDVKALDPADYVGKFKEVNPALYYVEKDDEGSAMIKDLVAPKVNPSRLPNESCNSSKLQYPLVVEPLFTMKRFDRYEHAPNENLLAQFVKSLHFDDDEDNKENFYDVIIHPHLKEQKLDPESFKILSETAFKCVKDQRQQRPTIDQILRNLEEALEIQKKLDHPPPLVANENEGTSSDRLKAVEHLRIPLNDIIAATNNFTKRYLGSGASGKVYAAELDLPTEAKGKREVSKKQRKTVAIKCIKKDASGKEGFVAEIELLTRCKHDNIVSLLGFCDEGDLLILVYEHVSNGSLDDYLGVNHKLTNLTWVQRLKICIDIARGLTYLHTTKAEDEQSIVHRDIKSGNILLNKNWGAKIADFGLSKFHHVDEQEKTRYSENIAGTSVYMCPEYRKGGKFKRAIDIYSFGVVLFEILSGKAAYDNIYITENEDGIAHVARRRFNEQTLIEMVDPIIMQEVDEQAFTLNKGPDQDSLKTFLAIAHKCVAETQKERPSAEQILKELEKALLCQENKKDNLQMSFKEIQSATQDFARENIIGGGGFGKVYKGEATRGNERRTIVAKRMDKKGGQGQLHFLTELEVLFEYKHENIIGLEGYCNEKDEKILVYEHAPNLSLEKHLKDENLTWRKRLKICIDVASGLAFLHGGAPTKEIVLHRDIKCANILLFEVSEDWKAKISDFGLSTITTANQEVSNLVGTDGYVDPVFEFNGRFTEKSDIYSFGVVLFEILYGKLLVPNTKNYDKKQVPLILNQIHDEEKLDSIVFNAMKNDIAPESLSTFRKIVSRCLQPDRENRPTAEDVLKDLKKALEFQEDFEIWKPKLPQDYEEIIKRSKSSSFTERKKDLFNMLTRGILLQDDKVWFSLGSNGKRNAMISARKFSYRNRSPHKWQTVSESRFQKVAKMLDISNLMIKIKTTTKYLSPAVGYGVYLVFKFCNPKELSSKPMYVNLKYRKGSETFHAYFATSRDKEWMMIELDRFINQTEEVVFKFLLESLSPYFDADDAIYVEGIEFRAINNLEHKEIEKSKEVQQVLISNLNNVDQVQEFPSKSEEISNESNDGEKLLPQSEMKKKHLMLSAKTALYNSYDLKLYKSTPSAESRFQEAVELLPQQVFRINCTIKAKDLSPHTTYVCYLVFKLAEECQGFHCPVEVRDLLHRGNKEAEVAYFKSPSPWNLHDIISQIPKQREDGWMELNVWKSNSDHALKNDLLVNLKFRSYEGTMSGLIVCGLEFRPM